MARNVKFEIRRGGGSSLEVLYGKVSLTPTNLHTLSSTAVLPAPTTFDLVNGTALATNVAPTPAPVDGLLPWGYKVKITDNYSKTWEYLVGVPDGTTEINFNVLPRYSETRPPAFGVGPTGPAGQSATIAIGTTASGPTPAVTNTGTPTDAVLNFTLAQGPQGPPGTGFAQIAAKPASDIPTTYPMGASVFWSDTTDRGYPFIRGQVVTVRSAWDRASQTIYNTSTASGTRVLTRESEGTTSGAAGWGPFKEYAFNDLATPLLNGLMPALDKAKLDGMTPAANSKTFAAAASTYQAGNSTLQVRTADGWPIPTTGTVVTQRNVSSSASTAQWLYPVEGGAPLYRVSDLGGNWQNFQTVATESSVSARTGFVRPEDFGAVGDGIADDSDPLEQAIAHGMTSSRTVVLDSSKVYGVSRTITNTVTPTKTSEAGKLCVSIRSSQEGNTATVRVLDSAPSSAARVVMRFSGTPLGTQPLSSSTQMQSRRWHVGAGLYFAPGMLVGFESSASWYYDPRPESTDARKSEIHRIEHQESAAGGTSNRYIHTEAPAFDSYLLEAETVTAHPFIPIKVEVKGIRIERALPPEDGSGDGWRRVGLEVYYGVDSIVEDVDTYAMTAKGIGLVNCYNSKIVGGSSWYCNNYYEGYGAQINGSTFCTVDGRYVTASRRGVDVSQGTRFCSKHTIVKNCYIVGGGKNSRGDYYGWNPINGNLAAAVTGMGSHGPADFTTYENNVILDTHTAFTVRGGNETIRGNKIYGRQLLGAIGLADGGGITTIEDNIMAGGWVGTPKNTTILLGSGNINNWRAKRFMIVYQPYDYDSPITGAQLHVRRNYAEVQDEFIQFGSNDVSAMPLRCEVVQNRITFDPPSGATDKYLLVNPDPTTRFAGERWTVALNDIYAVGTGTYNLTKRINLKGARVLDYATSGTTT